MDFARSSNRPISPDSAWKDRETPPPPPPARVWDLRSEVTAAAVTRRPSGSWERKTRSPFKRLTYPSQPQHRPLPLPRLPASPPPRLLRAPPRPAAAGGCGYLKGPRSRRGRKSWGKPAGLRGGAETTTPSRPRGRGRRPRSPSRRAERARRGWNVAGVGGSSCRGRSRTPRPAALRSGNPGGGQICN